MNKTLAEKAALHANLTSYKKRVRKAAKYIMEFLQQCKAPYVSFSGGKDSSVIADMANKIKPGIKVIHIRNKELDIPGNLKNVKQIKKSLGSNLEIVESQANGWEILKEQDSLFNQFNRSTSKLNQKCFFEPLKNKVKKEGYDGHIMGLRADESRARRMNFRFNGYIYERKNGMKVCCPIAHFSGIDVFAYLYDNDIPLHDVYSKTELGNLPERLRVGWWPPGEKTSKHGYCTWLKYYYPDLFNKLSQEFPEVRNYV